MCQWKGRVSLPLSAVGVFFFCSVSRMMRGYARRQTQPPSYRRIRLRSSRLGSRPVVLLPFDVSKSKMPPLRPWHSWASSVLVLLYIQYLQVYHKIALLTQYIVKGENRSADRDAMVRRSRSKRFVRAWRACAVVVVQ